VSAARDPENDAADPLEELRERFRKLARLAKGNGHEGARAAEVAAAMLREHGDAVLLQPPNIVFRALADVSRNIDERIRARKEERRARPYADDDAFRLGVRSWGTPEEKAAQAAADAKRWGEWAAEREAERPAREAAEAAEKVAKKIKARENYLRRKAEKKAEEAERAKTAKQQAAEAKQREAENRAAWEAERELRKGVTS
jgi:hypothetical protein